jgi:hypothetical protein
LAREWAAKRWSKPNAKALEAQDRARRKLAQARLDGDLAMVALVAGELWKALDGIMGRKVLLDERPLPVPSGGVKDGGKRGTRGYPRHPSITENPYLWFGVKAPEDVVKEHFGVGAGQFRAVRKKRGKKSKGAEKASA